MDLDFKVEDSWILSRLSNVSKEINENMDKYNIDQSCKLAFEFFKGDFCDWYVEIAKTRIYNSSDKADKLTAQWVLRHVLDYSLRLLHPFIPYVTEYIWQYVKVSGDTIMLSDFPTYDKALIDSKYSPGEAQRLKLTDLLSDSFKFNENPWKSSWRGEKRNWNPFKDGNKLSLPNNI